MARFCNTCNIPSNALSGESPKELRSQAQRRLENHEIGFIFTVDHYNEGIDIPSVDTVLFLRPTASLTLFFQQLGRGLRRHDEKSHLTVLDFIAPQHRNFSFAKRFKALTSQPELRIDKQIELDMPYVPSGCFLHLEKQAKEHVLQNIRSATANLRGERLLSELRQLRREIEGTISLQQMIDYLNLDSPDDIYRRGLPHQLLAEAEGKPQTNLMELNDQLSKGFRRLALMDDTHLIEDALRLVTNGKSDSGFKQILLHSLLWGTNRPGEGTLDHTPSASLQAIREWPVM